MTKSEREEGLTLLELLRQRYKPDETVTLFQGEEESHPKETLSDGYVRRSPAQPYREDPNGKRKRPPTALILCAVVLAVVLAAILLWRFVLR